ncbi:hypothetical protein I4F81_002930 [Pyropia yezoensis]|uniref:Uncharacterized protein n=1 Tax=Pyropia yezoensis TaxID=2788 RepID=A0ACC3BQR7_PYRYE|nr:hypothetical protein I4F81_002930 [Neopyropia yezoensis]
MACRGLSTLRAAAVATATGPRLRPLPSAAAIATALQQRLPRGGSPAAAVTPPALSTWRAAAGGPACPSYAQRAGTAPSSVSAHPSRPQALLRGGRSSAPPPPLLCRRRCLSAAAAPPPPPDEPPRGKPFLLADIGEGITTVTLSSWKVAVGDTVAAFDPISEVASDKASVEITAPWGGVIRGLAVAEGDTALVGKPLCWIDPGGEGGANDGTGGNDLASAAAAAEAGGGAAAVGASVAAGGGGGSGNGRAPASAADAREAPAAAAPAGRARVLAAPAVRARAREAGVDLARVDGTGPGGRVLAADVARVAAAAAAALPQDGAPFPPAAAAAAVADHREAVVQVPLTPVRSAMVRTMTDAAAIPHLRLITPVDVTALVGLRRPAPVKLTYLPFFIRATSMALTAHPALNATFPAPHDAVHVHAGHHISVAVDTPAGLHVPTVRDAARRPVTQLAAEVARLARAAAAGRLGVAEVSGGTVGLSNIGALGGRPPPAATAGAAADGDGPPPPAGGMVGLPLLLPPQVLIGAVGDIVWEPRLDADGSVTRRAVVQVCWAADHRVVEGGAVARLRHHTPIS